MCKQLPEMTCFYVGNDETLIYNSYVKNTAVDYPLLLTVHRIRGYHFKYLWPSIEDEPVENLVMYGTEIMNKVIKPKMRSKKIWDESGIVREVNGEMFEEEVVKSGEDVVIQFYAGACNHCTKMKKRFDKVASAFNEDRSLKFLRFSTNENDIDVEGFYVGKGVRGEE